MSIKPKPILINEEELFKEGEAYGCIAPGSSTRAIHSELSSWCGYSSWDNIPKRLQKVLMRGLLHGEARVDAKNRKRDPNALTCQEHRNHVDDIRATSSMRKKIEEARKSYEWEKSPS